MVELKNGMLSLGELFKNTYFQVPDFQRGYAWEIHQWDDFWKDIELLYSNSRHYAGQLILEPIIVDETLAAYNVVDGQQRLLTSILALKACVDCISKSKTTNIRSIAEVIQTTFHFTNEKEGRKYKLSYADGSPNKIYLAGAIFSDPRYSAQVTGIQTRYTENMRLAYDFFIQKFEAVSELKCAEFIERLTTSFQFNVFLVTQEFDIHVAFETINNRGRDLSQLELLKNRLIYLSTIISHKPEHGVAVATDLRREINETWLTIYKWLGNDPKRQLDDDELLTTHWIAYFGYNKSESNAIKISLFDDYFTARRIVDNELLIGDVQRYVRSLAQAATVWHYMHNPAPYLPPETTIWLQRIERLRWSSFKPLVLAAFLRLASGESRVVSAPAVVQVYFNNFLPLLKQIERFIFMVFYVTERRGHTGRTEIYKLATLLCPGGNHFTSVMDTKTHMEWATRHVGALNDNRMENGQWRHSKVGDIFHEFEGYFNLEDFRDSARRKLSRGSGYYGWEFTKVVLFEYEQNLQGKNKAPKVNWEHVSNGSIEHVYPQTPTDPYWRAKFPFDGRDAY
jgi:hypothetical protein